MTRAKKQPITRSWLPWLLVFSLSAGSQPVYGATPEYYEQIYLSENAALQQAFSGLKIEKRVLTPTAAQRTRIEKRLRRKFPERQLTLYLGKSGSQIQRYAFILNEKGKHYPITFIVSLDPSAKVQQVAVMVYREKRGDGVKRQRFLSQFRNKSSRDPIEVNTDIVHITGSTISSWSLAAGVRKAIALLEELVLRP